MSLPRWRQFRILVEGLLESYAHKSKLHKVFWHGWALWFDYLMGSLLTLLYTLSIAILFGWMNELPAPSSVVLHEL